MDPLLIAIRDFVHAVEALGIEYYIGGSVASTAYSDARTTRDVDFVLLIKPNGLDALLERLEPGFYVDRVAVERAVVTGDCFNALSKESVFQVDVFTPNPSPWVDSQFGRKQRHRIGPTGLEVYLCSPEDSVLSKLDWYRLGNEVSQQQWRDVIGVLRVQSLNLDRDYLARWARELGVVDLLDRALKQVQNEV